MRGVWFAGVAISVIPLVTLGIFNGLSLLGLIVVTAATVAIIRRELAAA